MNNKDLLARLLAIHDHVTAIVADNPQIASELEGLVVAILRAKVASATPASK